MLLLHLISCYCHGQRIVLLAMSSVSLRAQKFHTLWLFVTALFWSLYVRSHSPALKTVPSSTNNGWRHSGYSFIKIKSPAHSCRSVRDCRQPCGIPHPGVVSAWPHHPQKKWPETHSPFLLPWEKELANWRRYKHADDTSYFYLCDNMF